jgi:diguanylate cyclase (GGDEF)-like protein
MAGTLAERLRKHIESHALVLTSEPGSRQEVRVTVSIGVAGCSPRTEDIQELVHNADQALYSAKQAGRNRVTVHSAR